MTNSEGLNLIHNTYLSDICQRHDIAFLGLFGSHARGEGGAESDVDLLVRFSKPKGLLALVRIERELSQRLGRPVDLVTEGALSPYLKERIKAQLRTIYERS